jgi:putative superfamily III holin-X
MQDDATEASQAEAESWAQRLRGAFETARRLLSTRLAIFSEELGVKAGVLGRGLAALLLAAAFGGMSLFLFTAWIALVFSRLLGGPVVGILAAFGLYIAVAALAAWLGVRALSRVKPLEFPVTKGELAKDWEALRASATPEPEPPATITEPPAPPAGPGTDDLEARFRVGSE